MYSLLPYPTIMKIFTFVPKGTIIIFKNQEPTLEDVRRCMIIIIVAFLQHAHIEYSSESFCASGGLCVRVFRVHVFLREN